MRSILKYVLYFTFVSALVHADITVVFPVSGRGSGGRTYAITSTQLGTAFHWGLRGIYNFAPIHMVDGSYALLYTSCSNPGSGCAVGQPGGIYMATSPNGVTSWSVPSSPIIGNAPGVPDMAAPRAVNLNGNWYVYVQGTKTPGSNPNNALFVATGPSLTSLHWVTGTDGLAAPIVQINPANDNPTGAGIGEFHQWFNAAPYNGYPGYTLMGVYNDWNYAPASYQEFNALSPNGVSSSYWYGPTYPVVANGSGGAAILYPDVILSGSTDAALYGDISFTAGDGCYANQEKYRPLVALGFYNAPYLYNGTCIANGGWCSPQPVATYNANPGYSNAVIETSGPNNSGFRPRFARNQYGYIDPVPGSNPRQWVTYVYYTNSQIGQDSDVGCDYTQYNRVDATVGVSRVTITEQ